jgi:hypothetical protein
VGSLFSSLSSDYSIREITYLGYSTFFLGADIDGDVTLVIGENRIVTFKK